MYETRNIIKIRSSLNNLSLHLFLVSGKSQKSYFCIRNLNNAIFPSEAGHSSTVGCLNSSFLAVFPIGSQMVWNFMVVQSLRSVQLFVTTWTAAYQFPVHHYFLELTHSSPLIWGCHPTISSSVIFSSCLHSFPASGSSPMGQLFTSCGQSLELQLQHQSFQ